MGETLAQQLVKLASVLHWLGKNREANLLDSLARFLRAAKLNTVEQLFQLTVRHEEQNAEDAQEKREEAEAEAAEERESGREEE